MAFAMIYDPLNEMPPLHADGVHDDTEALQCYVDAGRGIPSGNFKVRPAIVSGRGTYDLGTVYFAPRLKFAVLAIYSAYGIEFGPIQTLQKSPNPAFLREFQRKQLTRIN